MKTLADGKEVSARSYYYLLDWNEVDEWSTLAEMFGVAKLGELTIDQYTALFQVATSEETLILKTK